MKKQLLAAILVITMVMTLPACGIFNPNNEPENQTDPGTSIEEPSEQEPEEQQEPQEEITKETTGIYTGQIDGNTVEINIENSPAAFVITEVEDQINSLQEDEKVRLKYVENEYGQLILKSIQKAE